MAVDAEVSWYFTVCVQNIILNQLPFNHKVNTTQFVQLYPVRDGKRLASLSYPQYVEASPQQLCHGHDIRRKRSPTANFTLGKTLVFVIIYYNCVIIFRNINNKCVVSLNQYGLFQLIVVSQSQIVRTQHQNSSCN
ncbi:Hypothetical_protein [Hexamita inflata]|uniref:Hypothetical_protein n=1 Tax=Hexamita inflata TaxID=28002 RepID=A0AA86TXZ7_9EUKA|nr:Hypothetical protein HINF_LOCUS4995 [Hexamita inflata]CAI9924943.1 Hypothetical protein HINF_LOCUS12588 [Hexamita inflata]